jgi:hypothetical protein
MDKYLGYYNVLLLEKLTKYIFLDAFIPGFSFKISDIVISIKKIK